MALSDAWLKANSNKTRASLAEFSDRDGLGVRVTPKSNNSGLTAQMPYWRAALPVLRATKVASVVKP